MCWRSYNLFMGNSYLGLNRSYIFIDIRLLLSYIESTGIEVNARRDLKEGMEEDQVLAGDLLAETARTWKLQPEEDCRLSALYGSLAARSTPD
jgi:hypothetical protein